MNDEDNEANNSSNMNTWNGELHVFLIHKFHSSFALQARSQ